jgi:hypothetical protein
MRALRVKAWIWDVRCRPEWPVGVQVSQTEAILPPRHPNVGGKDVLRPILGRESKGCGSDAFAPLAPPCR